MKTQVSCKILILLIGIQSLFSNYLVTYIPLMYYINLIVKVIFGIWLLLNYFNRFAKNFKADIYFLSVVSFNIILFLSTVINRGSIVKFLGYFMISICFTLLPKLYNTCEKEYFIFIKALSYIFRFNIYINFLLMIFFPNGFTKGTRINFLGYDNIVVPVVTVGFCVLMYCASILKTNNVLRMLDAIISIITIIILWSGTGIIGFSIMLVFITLIRKVPHINWYIIGCILIIVICVLVVGFNIVDYFSGLISFIGKDITFTGRRSIWDASLDVIRESWIWGLGIQENQALIYNPPTLDYRQAHNEYLQLLVNSGVLGLSTFFVSFFIGSRKANRIILNSINYKSCAHAYLLGGLIAFLTFSITETYGQYFMTSILLGLCYYNPFKQENAKFKFAEETL